VIWENGTIKEIPAQLLKTKYAALERKLTTP